MLSAPFQKKTQPVNMWIFVQSGAHMASTPLVLVPAALGTPCDIHSSGVVVVGFIAVEVVGVLVTKGPEIDRLLSILLKIM